MKIACFLGLLGVFAAPLLCQTDILAYDEGYSVNLDCWKSDSCSGANPALDFSCSNAPQTLVCEYDDPFPFAYALVYAALRFYGAFGTKEAIGKINDYELYHINTQLSRPSWKWTVPPNR